MSSTRKAEPGAPLRQERYASSGDYARGLLGNLVAKRTARLTSRAARERISFLAELSHRDPLSRHYTANLFPAWPWPGGIDGETALERVAREIAPPSFEAGGKRAIAEFLERLCLDPSISAESGTVEGFDVIPALDVYCKRFEAASVARVAETATVRKVYEVLDYARAQRGLVLMEGPYRTGKSYASQAWALANTGSARYIQITSARDEHSFLAAMARAVGIGCGLTVKTSELRFRVESVFRDQGLLLIIDEAEYVLPQGLRISEVPQRLSWILTALINQGVPVALVAGRNFSRLLLNLERSCKVYGLEQFYGRLRLRAELPAKLEQDDLLAIAAAVFPEAGRAGQMLLTGHALKTATPVPAIEAGAERARWFAAQESRAVTFEDVERVLIEAGTMPDCSTRISHPVSSISPRRTSAPPARSVRAVPAVTGEDRFRISFPE
jgi:hypothetical protein